MRTTKPPSVEYSVFRRQSIIITHPGPTNNILKYLQVLFMLWKYQIKMHLKFWITSLKIRFKMKNKKILRIKEHWNWNIFLHLILKVNKKKKSKKKKKKQYTEKKRIFFIWINWQKSFNYNFTFFYRFKTLLFHENGVKLFCNWAEIVKIKIHWRQKKKKKKKKKKKRRKIMEMFHHHNILILEKDFLKSFSRISSWNKRIIFIWINRQNLTTTN